MLVYESIEFSIFGLYRTDILLVCCSLFSIVCDIYLSTSCVYTFFHKKPVSRVSSVYLLTTHALNITMGDSIWQLTFLITFFYIGNKELREQSMCKFAWFFSQFSGIYMAVWYTDLSFTASQVVHKTRILSCCRRIDGQVRAVVATFFAAGTMAISWRVNEFTVEYEDNVCWANRSHSFFYAWILLSISSQLTLLFSLAFVKCREKRTPSATLRLICYVVLVNIIVFIPPLVSWLYSLLGTSEPGRLSQVVKVSRLCFGVLNAVSWRMGIGFKSVFEICFLRKPADDEISCSDNDRNIDKTISPPCLASVGDVLSSTPEGETFVKLPGNRLVSVSKNTRDESNLYGGDMW